MKIVKTDDFTHTFDKLPKEIKRLYQTQEERFKENWRDPRLHIKKVKSLKYAFSFRITRNYRVLFYFQDGETAVFFEADHRKETYR
jgi:mRNA-degrading endonuclease RelE of RelBE toxin-antitoxin system